jgi:TrmH family RNA methyltransferase
VGWCPELIRPHQASQIGNQLAHVPQIKLSAGQITELGFSPEPQGIVLVLRQQIRRLSEVVPSRVGTWIGVESLQSPGNLGSIFRSGAAAAAPGIFLFGNRNEYQDVFDPLVVRSSMGAHFDLQIVRCTYREFAKWQFRSEFRVLGADPGGTLDYRKVGYRRPLLLMIGNERHGLSPGQLSSCDSLVRIPMARNVDSLNVAMATTVLLFESFNQQRVR